MSISETAQASPHLSHLQKTASLLNIDFYDTTKGAYILRGISHKLRLEIIKTIHQNSPINVTHLYMKMRLDQAVASQHLAILRKTGIVYSTRKGKLSLYRINYSRLNSINELAKDLVA